MKVLQENKNEFLLRLIKSVPLNLKQIQYIFVNLIKLKNHFSPFSKEKLFFLFIFIENSLLVN